MTIFDGFCLTHVRTEPFDFLDIEGIFLDIEGIFCLLPTVLGPSWASWFSRLKMYMIMDVIEFSSEQKGCVCSENMWKQAF